MLPLAFGAVSHIWHIVMQLQWTMNLMLVQVACLRVQIYLEKFAYYARQRTYKRMVYYTRTASTAYISFPPSKYPSRYHLSLASS
jgi:hypothetical protein